jgi:hypothetical protein
MTLTNDETTDTHTQPPVTGLCARVWADSHCPMWHEGRPDLLLQHLCHTHEDGDCVCRCGARTPDRS